MGKHRDPQARLAQAKAMMLRNRRSFERHSAGAERARLRGDAEAASRKAALAARAEALLAKWQTRHRRILREIAIRTALTHRAPKPDIRPGRGPAARRLRESEERGERKRIAEKKRRMAQAGIDWNPGTASGRRTYDVVALGPSLRVSVNHLNAVLRRKADRTDARRLAWAKVDQHCDWVHAGLYPVSKLEPGVDTSTVPQVSEHRLAAFEADAAFRAFVGHKAHELLVEVIYHGRSFRDLSGYAGMPEREIGVLFRAALDQAAVYFRCGTG